MTDAIISLLRRRKRGHQNRIWSSSRYFEMKTSTSHVNKLRARRQLLDLSHGPVTDILFPITLLWASFLSLSLPTREEAKSDWFMESCGRLSWLNFLFFLGLIYSTQSFSVFDLLFVPLEYSLPSAAPPFWITTYMKSRVFDLMTETCSWNNSDEIRSDFRGLRGGGWRDGWGSSAERLPTTRIGSEAAWLWSWGWNPRPVRRTQIR